MPLPAVPLSCVGALAVTLGDVEPKPGAAAPSDRSMLRAQIEANLPGCSPDSYAFLTTAARVRPTRRHDTIFAQGEPVTLSLLICGHGAFRRTTRDGRQVTVGLANPGELFGITSISSVISSVDMVAMTDGQVATWSGQEFRRLAAKDPEMALDVIDRLSSFLNVLTEKVDGFLHQDARRRVTRILARHKDVFFADPPVVSRADLPGLVGTSREMTGRVLRELEREGTVARVGRTGLKLLSPEALEKDNEQLMQLWPNIRSPGSAPE